MPVEGVIPVPEKLQTTISFFPEGGDLIEWSYFGSGF